MDSSGAATAQNLAEIFKALSEPHRLRIVALLRTGTLCVCDLEGALGLRQSNLSRHLAVLKRAGLVTTSRKATFVYYQLCSNFQNSFDFSGFLAQLHGEPWTSDLISLKAFLAQKNIAC